MDVQYITDALDGDNRSESLMNANKRKENKINVRSPESADSLTSSI